MLCWNGLDMLGSLIKKFSRSNIEMEQKHAVYYTSQSDFLSLWDQMSVFLTLRT